MTRIRVAGSPYVLAAVLTAAMLACSDDPAAPKPLLLPDQSVSVSYCDAVAPTWVAFRDGDGAWTREMPIVAGSTTTFRHSFSSSRAAIALFTPIVGGAFKLVRVLHGDTPFHDPCYIGAGGSTYLCSPEAPRPRKWAQPTGR